MDQAVSQNQDLTDRLVSALRQDEFVLHGQRIAPLAPDGSERPFQEILIRFQEEEAKLLPPGSFFPVLEECGLMPYVDRWVVSRVARWVRSALVIKPDWPVPHNSVNLSNDTLADRGFAAFTRRHLLAAALPGGTISFEVTCASALAHAGPLRDLMVKLRPEGCRLILARFDGDNSGFELLRRLAPEFVKFSPALVRILETGTAGQERLHTINRACHALGIKTIAEHVESDRARVQLRALGVDFGQGFAIHVPQPLV